MSRYRLASIHVYPIKSCRGISLREARLGLRGIEGDRAWMLVDPDGVFLSQRRLPRMALIEPRVRGEGLEVAAPGMEPLRVDGPGEPRKVTIWGDRCLAEDAGDEAASWFSRFLDTPCRLVRQAPAADRPVRGTEEAAVAGPEGQVSFADGFPLLLTTTGSLDDLSRRVGRPIPMNRFRPNLVVAGAEPWEEDHWRRLRVDGVDFRVAKPCIRCVITTVDQQTGQAGREPLATLGEFRRTEAGVAFGQNLIHLGRGTLRVGAVVEVLERTPGGSSPDLTAGG